MKVDTYVCANCKFKVDDDSDYCPRCGTLSLEDVNCEVHTNNEADGVCVICAKPFCNKCGHSINNVFLCNEHDGYEIYEGMARVFGTSDAAQVEYIKSCLDQESLHPYVYSRKSSPMHLGGTDYSLFRTSGDFNGHIINELKLMVPCGEALEAEKLISEINIQN